MARCEYCDQQMTSASSHMDHLEECAKNPKNEVTTLLARLTELHKALQVAWHERDRVISEVGDLHAQLAAAKAQVTSENRVELIAWAREEARKIHASEREARAALALVKTPVADVWFWMGDGHDDPASMSCPVVMSAETLRTLVYGMEEWRKRALAAESQVKWESGKETP